MWEEREKVEAAGRPKRPSELGPADSSVECNEAAELVAKQSKDSLYASPRLKLEANLPPLTAETPFAGLCRPSKSSVLCAENLLHASGFSSRE